MLRHNKVVWSEGLFISPQLFQQQERYLESYIHQRLLPLIPYFWGINRLEIDHHALAIGKFTLTQAGGIFQDGTPFSTSSTAVLPDPIDITEEHVGQRLYLAIPLSNAHENEVIFTQQTDSLARYQVKENDIADICMVKQAPRLVQLAQLRLTILPEQALSAAWVALPIAKVSALQPNKQVDLDTHCIPPLLHHRAHPLLGQWLNNIADLMTLRADTLAAQITNVHQRSTNPSEVSDYLLLQIFNRYTPLLQHYLSESETDLPTLYRLLITLLGEISTFIHTKTRRPIQLDGYQHSDPYHSFSVVTKELYRLLNEVLVKSAQQITIENRQHGVKLAVSSPAALQSYSSMVLAISADMPADALAQQFAARSKIGPTNRLPELIRSHLPGLTLTALPVPPRQMPFNAGFVYFELGCQGSLWEQTVKYGGLAMHIAGNFPGLQVELWGIHDKSA